MSETYTPRDIVEMAVQAKDKSVDLYMTLARNSENYHVSQLFVKLAQDKQRQKIRLKKWLEDMSSEKREEAYPGERSLFLKALVDDKTFKCGETQKQALEMTISEEEALKSGINFEKDFMLFLHEMKRHVDGKDTEVIDSLIDEESNYVREMFDIKDKLQKGK